MNIKSYSLVGTIGIVLAVVISVFFVVMAVNAATTVSTNIVTDGSINATSTLSVDGLSTFAGFVSTASSTVTGDFNVGLALTSSSTLAVGSLSTLAGFISTASSTIDGDFNVGLGGALTASSTLNVGGIGTFDSSVAVTGGLTRQNDIWTYNSSGNLVSTTSLPIVTSSTLGVNGSTTPALTLGVAGNIIASSTEATNGAVSATTTLVLATDGGTTGGCIEMKDVLGVTTYKLFLVSSSTNATTDSTSVILFVEAGTCR